jgi:hypothetical protein
MKMRMMMMMMMNINRLLVGKADGKRPLGRPRCGWVNKNKIKMDLVEIGWIVEHWIGLALDRNKWRALVKAILNLWVQ